MRDLKIRAYIVAVLVVACAKNDPATATEVLTPGPGNCFRPWVVNPASVSVYAGDTTRFRVTSNCIPTLPEVRWSVGDARFAEIDSITGLARGTGLGSVTIIATSVADRNERAAAALTVVSRP